MMRYRKVCFCNAENLLYKDYSNVYVREQAMLSTKTEERPSKNQQGAKRKKKENGLCID